MEPPSVWRRPWKMESHEGATIRECCLKATLPPREARLIAPTAGPLIRAASIKPHLRYSMEECQRRALLRPPSPSAVAHAAICTLRREESESCLLGQAGLFSHRVQDRPTLPPCQPRDLPNRAVIPRIALQHGESRLVLGGPWLLPPNSPGTSTCLGTSSLPWSLPCVRQDR